MAASTTLSAAVTAATTAALAVASTAAEDGYSTRQEAESAINSARELISDAVALALSEEPLLSQPLVRKLRSLAARLLELGMGLQDALATVTIVTASERSAIDLALELYSDGLRADEIIALNRGVKTPLRIPAGTSLVVYAS